jgi:hypothetical protein
MNANIESTNTDSDRWYFPAVSGNSSNVHPGTVIDCKFKKTDSGNIIPVHIGMYFGGMSANIRSKCDCELRVMVKS